jgi:glycerophosphoryl diester phosphodiesterase
MPIPKYSTFSFVGFFAVLLATSLIVDRSFSQSIVAHRGASFDAPENTLAAFNLAWEQGADAIEGDFYLTADQQIVCIHDKTTKRTAGVELKVADSTLDQLRQLEYGAWKSEKFQGEPIPTLDQVLATVPALRQVFIEVKCGAEIVPHMKRAFEQSALARDQIVVISFNEDVIAETKSQIPDIAAFWLTGYKQDEETGQWAPDLPQVLNTLEKTRADGLDTQAEMKVLDPTFVQSLRDKGYAVHTWTVDDPDQALALRHLGVDSITTNRPQFIREALNLLPASVAVASEEATAKSLRAIVCCHAKVGRRHRSGRFGCGRFGKGRLGGGLRFRTGK